MQNNLENLPAGSVHVCWSGPRVSSLCTGRGWNCWIVLPCWKRTSQCCWAFCWSRRPVISWRTWSGSEYRDISLNHSSKEKQIFFSLHFTFFSFYILSILCISFLIKYLCSCPLYHSYPSYPIPILTIPLSFPSFLSFSILPILPILYLSLLSTYHFHPFLPWQYLFLNKSNSLTALSLYSTNCVSFLLI